MSWPMVKLGDLFKITSGGTPSRKKSEYYDGGDIHWVKTGDLHNKYVRSASEFITQEGLASSSARLYPKGTVLVAMYGATIGACSILDIEAATNQACAAFTPTEKVDPVFLYYLLKHSKPAFVKAGSGGAQPNISGTFLKNFEIPLPPLEEQKRIAAILDKADAIRQKRKQAIALADEFLRSVFLEMFGDPVTNPKGWEVKEVSTVCTEIVDCVNRTAPTVDYETPYKMIRTTNVRDKKINLSETRYVEFETYKTWVRRLKPQKGDLIFTREAPAGEAGVIETDDFIFLGQRTMHFRPNQTLIHPVFLLHELTASGVKRQIVKLSAGSTVTHLSVPECKKFLIRVPNIEKQLSFVKLARELEKQINRSSEFFRESEVFFNALSQKAFSGQL
ncbi:restriction endonuclease subunit S [Vibrio mimicus]|nr:restriction endonuclease subunit S [Vibrio mimicus]QXC58897.1 restriction endonuclease subunit S [Vibrio mimicus]